MLSALSQFAVTQPAALATAAGIALLVAVIAFHRRLAMPKTSLALAGIGAAALCLASGGARWLRTDDSPASIVVMVDQSASTRGANWHHPDWLHARIRQLVGQRAYEMTTFGDKNAPLTEFSSPAGASAILLFSDGRFAPPDFSPPIFPAIDSSLDHPPDAAVTDIEWRDHQAIVSLRNDGQLRILTLHHNATDWAHDAPAGAFVVARALDAGGGRVSATLSTEDRWPENDTMSMVIAPPARAERWWVSDGSAPPNWRWIPPARLPTDAAAYLAPAVVALINVPAHALSDVQQQRLSQFVQELGGGLVIVGGDRAFAAGRYTGSTMEALSPLSSTPPDPRRRWILLADASGSMARSSDGAVTHWSFAVDALRQTASALPPADTLRIGHFAGELQWWSIGAGSSEDISIPPIAPSGPTRLEPALRAILSEPYAQPTELIVLTDAEAQITDIPILTHQLAQQRIRLHVLATQLLAPDNPVAHLARESGGAVVAQADPRLWTAALRDLARSATPDLIMRQAIAVTFLGELANWPQRHVEQWNRAWLKSDAELLASATHQGGNVPMLGIWYAGSGKAIAAAYPASADDVQSLSAMVAAPPTDPRFSVRWNGQSVRLDAIEKQIPINGLAVLCRIDGRVHFVPQVAPGRYELRFDRPRAPSIAELMVDGSVISRRSLTAGYAREFGAIGNDRNALGSLAARTGGRVILPDDPQPIDLEWSSIAGVRLTPWLAGIGAFFIVAALLTWKWMG